jgi:hypothetical protein
MPYIAIYPRAVQFLIKYNKLSLPQRKKEIEIIKNIKFSLIFSVFSVFSVANLLALNSPGS